jgi:hypothetical protein
MAFPFAKIAVQPRPQTALLRSGADICIYGGAAGGGKNAGLILEPLRHVGRVANFTAVFFRRTMPQITNPGALWDESLNFYPRLGGTRPLRLREWRWQRGGKIKFSNLHGAGLRRERLGRVIGALGTLRAHYKLPWHRHLTPTFCYVARAGGGDGAGRSPRNHPRHHGSQLSSGIF